MFGGKSICSKVIKSELSKYYILRTKANRKKARRAHRVQSARNMSFRTCGIGVHGHGRAFSSAIAMLSMASL